MYMSFSIASFSIDPTARKNLFNTSELFYGYVIFLRKILTLWLLFYGVIVRLYIGIPMGTKYAPLPVNISVLMRSGIHTVFVLGWKETASQFNFT